MSADIFISYTAEDKAFAEQLAQYLTETGFFIAFDKAINDSSREHEIELNQLIRACKVLLLVQSPAALTSTNLERQIREAHNHGKEIVQLVWQPGAVPLNWLSLLLNAQKVEFNGEASEANFKAVVEQLKSFVPLATPPHEASPTDTSPTSTPGKRKLGQSASKPAQPVSEALALASPTILNVVSPLNLSRNETDSLTEELRWLFSATDNLLTIHKKVETDGVLDRSQPISIPLPLQAQLTISEANNQLVPQPPPEIARIYTTVEEALQYSWAEDVRGELRDLKVHLNALSTLLSREASQGEAAKKDAALQNNITGNRILVVEKLTTIAKTINQAYGVLVSAPDRLLAHLEQRDFETEPTVWGGLIISTVFAAFDLDAEDRSFVEDELRWLLSAAANLLAIARRLKTEGVLDPSQPIAAPTPAGAELTVPEADNRLLQQPAALSSQTHGYQTVAEILQQEWQGETQGELHNLSIYLNNLKIMLDRAAELGQAGQVGFALQDKIKKSRLAVVAALQSLAGTMAEAYGISVSSPTQLLEFLAD